MVRMTDTDPRLDQDQIPDDRLSDPVATFGPPRRRASGDAVAMFISAAIFGYFGFYHFSGSPTNLLSFLVVWSVRGGAIGFALSGVMALAGLPWANLFYALVSAVTVILFAICGIWILLDPNLSNMQGVILLLFAFWNAGGLFRSVGRVGRRRA